MEVETTYYYDDTIEEYRKRGAELHDYWPVLNQEEENEAFMKLEYLTKMMALENASKPLLPRRSDINITVRYLTLEELQRAGFVFDGPPIRPIKIRGCTPRYAYIYHDELSNERDFGRITREEIRFKNKLDKIEKKKMQYLVRKGLLLI